MQQRHGKLYFGTLPAGRVMSLEAGRSATLDSALALGWRHIAAVRKAGKLTVYVDGEAVAGSSEFMGADYNLNNSQPLRIGCGQHDYFTGRIADLRIYRGALDVDKIRELNS